MRQLNSKVYGEKGHIKLLVLHGLFGMLDNWSTLGRAWAEQGLEVHLIDLRGHGRSFWDNDMSIGSMSEDVFSYIINNKLEKAYILGHSMGGKIAMRFACDHPELIDGLIVADISPKYYKPHHTHIINALNGIASQKIESRQQAESILSEKIEDKSVRGFLLKSLYADQDKTYKLRFDLDSIDKNQDVLGAGLMEGDRFEGKTLFVKGDRSWYISEDDYLSISKHFPNSQIKMIEDAGHWLHADRPDIFGAAVLDFVRGK